MISLKSDFLMFFRLEELTGEHVVSVDASISNIYMRSGAHRG